MTEIAKRKVPPTGGSHLPHAHPSSFEIQLELDQGCDGSGVLVATIGSGDCRMTWRRAGADAAIDYYL